MTIEELRNNLPIECRLRFASGKLHIGGIKRSVDGRYQDIELVTDGNESVECLFDQLEETRRERDELENEREKILDAVDRVLVAHAKGEGLEAELNKLQVASIL